MIKVTENDKLDFNYVLIGLKTTMDYIKRALPETASDERVNDYYFALMNVLRDFKIKEHILRCKFAKKYKVPYVFRYKDGVIEC